MTQILNGWWGVGRGGGGFLLTVDGGWRGAFVQPTDPWRRDLCSSVQRLLHNGCNTWRCVCEEWNFEADRGATLCESVHPACSPGQPQQNTHQQGCLSVSNDEAVQHPPASAAMLLNCCSSTWVKMGFLLFLGWEAGEKTFHLVVYSAELAGAFAMRTTKWEAAENAGTARRGSPRSAGSLGSDPLSQFRLFLFQKAARCHCCNDNPCAQSAQGRGLLLLDSTVIVETNSLNTVFVNFLHLKRIHLQSKRQKDTHSLSRIRPSNGADHDDVVQSSFLTICLSDDCRPLQFWLWFGVIPPTWLEWTSWTKMWSAEDCTVSASGKTFLFMCHLNLFPFLACGAVSWAESFLCCLSISSRKKNVQRALNARRFKDRLAGLRQE